MDELARADWVDWVNTPISELKERDIGQPDAVNLQTPTIAIQEENSSDNFPALGHLDGFQLQTTEDGTILPSTVNAKMADGSYRRVTLYPQLVDGNITCMVQFEDNQEAEKPASSGQSILQKIDELILNNENITEKSGILAAKTKALTKETKTLRNPIIPYRNRPKVRTKLNAAASTMLKEMTLKTKVTPPATIPKKNQRSLLKPITPVITIDGHIQQPVAPTPNFGISNVSQKVSQVPLIIKKPVSISRIDNLTKKISITASKPTVVQLNKNAYPSRQNVMFQNDEHGECSNSPIIVPNETFIASEMLGDAWKTPTQNLESQRKSFEIASPTTNERSKTGKFLSSKEIISKQSSPFNLPEIASNQNNSTFATTPNTLENNSKMPEKEKTDADGNIVIKSYCGRYIQPKNAQPLGSPSNPFTLIRDGQTYQSKQPLSELQLKQISAILKKHKDKVLQSERDFLIDPVTNSKIAYQVVYPDEKTEPTEPTAKRKRGRKRKLTQLNPTNENGPAEDVAPTVDTTAVSAAPSKKVITMPRTRSGRLSRPPAHIVKDYNRIDASVDRPSQPVTDQLLDYENAQEQPPIPNTTPVVPLNQYCEYRKLKKRSNFKSEYRCPTCHKVYLGHNRMIMHLRKFPDHSSIVDYRRKLEQKAPRPPPQKTRTNKQKLLRLVRNMDRSVFGPILAETFSVWEFLLVRVSRVRKSSSGANEVETLMQELYGLLEKLGRILEELLVPVYEHEDGKEDSCIRLDKHEVAYALGMAQGSYKVNPTQLHLLRLKDAEVHRDHAPPPPPPPPPQPRLTTQFEPNLSTKLLDCSNDSIDLDSSSKDVEHDDEKKEWESAERADDTNSEFLSEYLENDLPSGADEEIPLWKRQTESGREANPWTVSDKLVTIPSDQPEMWKDGESPCAANNGDLWKQKEKNWTSVKRGGEEPKEGPTDPKPDIWRERGEQGVEWTKEKCSEWEGIAEKEGKKDWLRQWKEEGVSSVPGMRTSRLTSTPETASTLFTTPLRRNSVSSFAPSHQEELLSLDLHELFDDLIPEQSKPRPKPGSIESIINEALGNDPTPSRTQIPPGLITHTLDQVANLDFLNQD